MCYSLASLAKSTLVSDVLLILNHSIAWTTSIRLETLCCVSKFCSTLQKKPPFQVWTHYSITAIIKTIRVFLK